jgi:hypothetical protein
MKRIGIAVWLLSTFFFQTAFSQELTEGQKRRLHLPYVRSATDCFARSIQENTPALDLAREGKWYDALSAVGKVCETAIITMIDVHDRLYGPNSGSMFFKGPYLDDLPRAVGTRLKDALSRRSAELEQASAAQRQRIDEATRTKDLLRDRMYECTTKELAELVVSAESAEILATAAMTICNKEVQAALDSAVQLMRLQGSSTDGLRDELSGVVKRNVVTNAVQARANARQASPTAQSLPAAAPPINSARNSNMKTVDECLKLASSLREGQLVEQEKLVSMMLDICRPEIEGEARSKFLADPSKSLTDLRTQALESAVTQAKSLINAD